MLINAWHKHTQSCLSLGTDSTSQTFTRTQKTEVEKHSSEMAERKKLISIFFADMKYFCQLSRKTPTTLHIQRVATHLIWKHCWMTIGKRHWGPYSSVPSPKRTRRKQNQQKLITQTLVRSLKCHILAVQRFGFVRIDASRHRRKSVPHLLTLGLHFEN